jgi:hypothetical protein
VLHVKSDIVTYDGVVVLGFKAAPNNFAVTSTNGMKNMV